jgi:hypothetical protein
MQGHGLTLLNIPTFINSESFSATLRRTSILTACSDKQLYVQYQRLVVPSHLDIPALPQLLKPGALMKLLNNTTPLQAVRILNISQFLLSIMEVQQSSEMKVILAVRF